MNQDVYQNATIAFQVSLTFMQYATNWLNHCLPVLQDITIEVTHVTPGPSYTWALFTETGRHNQITCKM